MATTGYFEQQAGGSTQQQKWLLRLEYSFDTNDAGTVTTITWTLKVYDGTGESWNDDGSAYYWITSWSGNQYLSYHYTDIGWYTLGTFVDTYSRTPGEARTITADAAWFSGLSSSYTPDSISLSESLTFPAVAGATTPIVGDVTLGSAITINLPRGSDAFTHALTYSFGNATGTIDANAGATASWTPSLDLATQIPSAVSGTGTITCTTYNGSTVIGTKTINFTASVPASVVPTISSCTVTPVNDNTWINSKGIYVVGYTNPQVQTAANGVYGSTIKRIDISGDIVNAGAATSSTNTPFTTSGNKSITVTVTDTRGRTATASLTCTVQPYKYPSIGYLTCTRGTYANDTWVSGTGGSDLRVTFVLGLSLTDYSNAATISVAVDGESTQSTSGAAAGSKTYYFTTIGTDVSRAVTITAVDSVGKASSKTATVSTVVVGANYDPATRAMRIGGVAENANTFRCSFPAIFDTDVTILGSKIADVVIETGSDATGWGWRKWVSGRVEAWKRLSVGTVVNTAAGSLYTATMSNLGLPSGVFASAPLMYASAINSDVIIVTYATSATAYTVSIISPVSYGSVVTWPISIFAVGTWK